MQNFYFSSQQVKALISLLGEKNGLIKEPQIDISTDRDDKFLIKSIADFYKTISDVANILNVSINNLLTERIDEESDHESVSHKVILNPFDCYQKGFIHKLNNEFYLVDDYDYDTSTVCLTSSKSGEKVQVNRFKLQTVSWIDIYPELFY
tara:strand:- start:5470 stop:5919 length:450 start_codon:yes stop_codon:yes gene_type:complete